MLKKNAKTVHLIYGILVSVLIVALGVALVLSCLDIYRADPTGDPYSPATISAHFHDIAILLYATLAAILGGILISLFLPLKAEKPKPIRDERALMLKAEAKAEVTSSSEKAYLKKERMIRIIITVGCAVIFAGLMIYPAIYIFRFHNYSAPNPTAEVIRTSLIVFAPAVLGFLVCHIGNSLVMQSYRHQTTFYKSLPQHKQAVVTQKKSCPKGMLILRCTIFVAALVLIVLGVLNKTAADVLAKAAAICTECIGLG